MPSDQRQPAAGALATLAEGDLEIQGRMPWSSNATFLVTACLDGHQLSAIYKPHRGERPLWDFPGGLYRREAAAYELSVALGWCLVPETLVRQDAPLGPGSLQRFVDADFSEHYFTLVEVPDHHESLRRIAVFDLLANNADRKSGHCLLAGDQIWGIDHGLCFHTDPKLRTVIWDFAGDVMPEGLLDDVRRFAGEPVSAGLRAALDDDEVDALIRRAEAVVRSGRFPNPNPDRRPYPWPLV